jgi:Methyltransferase domain
MAGHQDDHPTRIEPERISATRRGFSTLNLREGDSGDPTKTHATSPGGRRKRHGARNQDRHKLFVKWLLDRFDHLVYGDSSMHVLDVAGGKGEVSARLCMCHQLQVVMVDPRPADIVNCFESLVLPKIPKKWQQRLEAQRLENSDFVKHTVGKRFRQRVTTFDDSTLAESTELQNDVEQALLLIGLHADGATEAIVDAALKYQKPFVVVPCCVFPTLFIHRQVMDPATNTMRQVRSHDQFCMYLLAKDPRFQFEILPFEGRNAAIWWDGK